MQEEQSTDALTPQLAKDLIELLANPSLEVRHGTIGAVLQYTPSSESKLMFKDTNLIQLLRKYVFEPKLTTVCLSTLIHFATEDEFLTEYHPLVEPLVYELKNWKEVSLDLGLLLLLNISKDEHVISSIVGEEDKRGYLVEVLFALLEREEKNKWVLIGIFVNMSSVERGRRYLIQEALYKRFVPFLNSPYEKVREGTLKITRNCSFEWEDANFLVTILAQQVALLPHLSRLIVFMISRWELSQDQKMVEKVTKQYLTEHQHKQWLKTFQSSSKEAAIAEIETSIDIVLILSNGEIKEKVQGFDKEAFKGLISFLKFIPIKEETKDKLEALEIFVF